jgi:hypothetical protein
MDTVRGIHEKRTVSRRPLKKSKLFMEIATTKKRRIDPTLCTSECTENPGNGYKRN